MRIEAWRLKEPESTHNHRYEFWWGNSPCQVFAITLPPGSNSFPQTTVSEEPPPAHSLRHRPSDCFYFCVCPFSSFPSLRLSSSRAFRVRGEEGLPSPVPPHDRKCAAVYGGDRKSLPRSLHKVEHF